MLKNTSYFNNFNSKKFSLLRTQNSTALFDLTRLETVINKLAQGIQPVLILDENIEYSGLKGNLNLINLTLHANYENWVYNSFELSSKGSAIFLLTIEYLFSLDDPRPLLRILKKELLANLASRVVLIQAQNLFNQLRFSAEEIIDFLQSSGFIVEPTEYGMLISITKEHYTKYLQQNNIDQNCLNSHYLLLTTEDSALGLTGGIGTYVRNLKKIYKNLTILNCKLENTLAAVIKTGAISPYHFNLSYDKDNYINGFGLIEVVRCILYLLPAINIIETQDFLSYAYRLVQARETGLLPNQLFLKIFLHGNTDHMKYALQDSNSVLYSMSELQDSVKDNYIFKHADKVLAPSNYIASQIHQHEYGYQFSNIEVIKLPYAIDSFARVKQQRSIKLKKLVFVGKYIKIKGWPDFKAVITKLAENQLLAGFDEIISFCPDVPCYEDEKYLQSLIKYSYARLKHADFLEYLKQHRDEVLFIVPASGESYSLLVLELMLTGCVFIAYDKGAIPEVVELEEFKQQVLCSSNSDSLALKIINVLNQPAVYLSNIFNTLQDFALNRQEQINQQWLTELEQVSPRQEPHLSFNSAESEISLAIPVYNTRIEFISNLIESINCSSLIPQQVLFISDGSNADYEEELALLIEEKLAKKFNYKLIFQTNQGLAGARNRALIEVKSKYLMVLDSDDILLPNTLAQFWLALTLDPELVATAGFHADFKDLNEINNIKTYSHAKMVWKPLGTNLARALSLYNNQNMSANCMVRVDVIREVGGWDASDKATWEDWAFYNKLAWLNYKFTVTPILGCLYRRNPESMSQTYNVFFGQRRIIRNLPGLTKLDALIITNLIQQSGVKIETFECSTTERKLLEKIRRLRTNRIIDKVVRLLLRLKGTFS